MTKEAKKVALGDMVGVDMPLRGEDGPMAAPGVSARQIGGEVWEVQWLPELKVKQDPETQKPETVVRYKRRRIVGEAPLRKLVERQKRHAENKKDFPEKRRGQISGELEINQMILKAIDKAKKEKGGE